MQKAGKFLPSVVGGLVSGLALLSIAVPRVGPFCCCLFCLAGGLIASILLVRSSSPNHAPVGVGDGAVVGLLAGLWAGILSAVIVFVSFSMLWDNPEFKQGIEQAIEQQPPQNREQAREMLKTPALFGAILAGMDFVFLIVVNLIGGMIGAALFEKRKGDKAGPPPSYPDYPGQGGHPGGGYPGGGYPGQ